MPWISGVSNALAPGESRLAVDGGRIWYRVVGSGSATPAILLHGGPGYSSVYMRSLEALGAFAEQEDLELEARLTARGTTRSLTAP